MPRELPGIGKVWDVDEITESMGVSRCTVLRRYRAGTLRGQRFGRSIFFTEAALRDFLEGVSKPRPSRERPQSTTPPTEREAKSLIDAQRITDAMKRTGNHRAQAAKLLEISEVWLRHLMKKYGLSFPSNRGRKQDDPHETKRLF